MVWVRGFEFRDCRFFVVRLVSLCIEKASIYAILLTFCIIAYFRVCGIFRGINKPVGVFVGVENPIKRGLYPPVISSINDRYPIHQ